MWNCLILIVWQLSVPSDQLQAIQSMSLTSTDMMDLMQALGAGLGLQGTPNPQSTPDFTVPNRVFGSADPPDSFAGGPPSSSTGGTIRNFPPGGVIIQDGPSGDASSGVDLSGGQALQATPDASIQATAQARFSTQASQVNSILLNLLISKLQAKTTG
jgi:hypothetical protein